jgi:5-methylthioadenosine/S-adenosylhomocysteine deaminase
MVDVREIDLLLTGGTVVTVDADRRVLLDGAVAIDGGRIVAVGPSDEIGQQYPARKVIECRGKAVLPGLIDAHGHGGHSLIKTIGADTPTFWMRIVTASRSIGITSGGDRTAAEHLPSCR